MESIYSIFLSYFNFEKEFFLVKCAFGLGIYKIWITGLRTETGLIDKKNSKRAIKVWLRNEEEKKIVENLRKSEVYNHLRYWIYEMSSLLVPIRINLHPVIYTF